MTSVRVFLSRDWVSVMESYSDTSSDTVRLRGHFRPRAVFLRKHSKPAIAAVLLYASVLLIDVLLYPRRPRISTPS